MGGDAAEVGSQQCVASSQSSSDERSFHETRSKGMVSLFEADLTLSGDGHLQFNWDNDGANAPLNNVQVFQAFSESPVPEPATLTLLAIGACGVLGYGWRRQKRAV